jgi:hypothetical protein
MLQKIVGWSGAAGARQRLASLRAGKKWAFPTSTSPRSAPQLVESTPAQAERHHAGLPQVDTLHTGKYIALPSPPTPDDGLPAVDTRKIVASAPVRSASGRAWSSTTPRLARATIRRAGYESIIINNKPETVSTDYTTAT